jgi:hypothetical protein
VQIEPQKARVRDAVVVEEVTSTAIHYPGVGVWGPWVGC